MAEILTRLSAALLPHQQWAGSQWFYANRLWFYHRPGAHRRIVANQRFFELIDPELRELCRLLHSAGFRTTPSCQGHSYPRQRFERVWEELKREEGEITGQGLMVRDCETDEESLFRDPAYRLPWGDFGRFYYEAAAHQEVGYLGIATPEDVREIYVQTCDPLERMLRWREVTEDFRKMLVRNPGPCRSPRF
jgi:hypothetical protein